jgi:hypothetical protein
MRNGCLVVLLWSLFLPCPATAQGPDGAPDLGANAALKYWKAIVLLPTLDKDQETLLQDWSKVPLDASALKLIAASEESRLYLHRGAKLRHCDWSPDYEDGLGLLLPHLAKTRDLARLAALHARHEFEQGHWRAGADDATAILTLSRHVGSDPIMISILVRYLIESTAIDLLAPYLPELQAFSPGIIAAYESLPAGATFEQTYLSTEKQYTIRWMINALKDAEGKKKGGWRDVWKKVFDTPESRAVADRIDSFPQAVEAMEDLLPVCDQMAVLVTLPRDQFEAQYPAFKEKVKATHRLAGHFLTAPDKVLATRHRNEARMAMLNAASAVVRGGPEALRGIDDPFGDGPFTYRALDHGFELKSKLIFQEKPVTLTVGQKKPR